SRKVGQASRLPSRATGFVGSSDLGGHPWKVISRVFEFARSDWRPSGAGETPALPWTARKETLVRETPWKTRFIPDSLRQAGSLAGRSEAGRYLFSACFAARTILNTP